MNMNRMHPKHGGVKWVDMNSGKDKECPIDRSVKLIDPNGNVCVVALATGSYIPRNRNMGYESHILESKLRKGWLEYDALGEDEREAVIAERQSKHNERVAGFADAFKTQADRITEVNSKSIDKLVSTLSDSMERGRRGRKAE